MLRCTHSALINANESFRKKKAIPNRIGRCCLYGLALLHLIPNTVFPDEISWMRFVLPLYRCGISNRFAAFLETGCLFYLNERYKKVMFIPSYICIVLQYMQLCFCIIYLFFTENHLKFHRTFYFRGH